MNEINATKLGLTAVVAAAAVSLTSPASASDFVKLQFSDGRPDVHGTESVNAVLRAVGCARAP